MAPNKKVASLLAWTQLKCSKRHEEPSCPPGYDWVFQRTTAPLPLPLFPPAICLLMMFICIHCDDGEKFLLNDLTGVNAGWSFAWRNGDVLLPCPLFFISFKIYHWHLPACAITQKRAFPLLGRVRGFCCEVERNRAREGERKRLCCGCSHMPTVVPILWMCSLVRHDDSCSPERARETERERERKKQT